MWKILIQYIILHPYSKFRGYLHMYTLSIIVPVFNEKDNITELANQIASALPAAHVSYEVIWVDDGSTDGSRHLLKQIQQNFKHHKVILLARNYGQTTALSAGIKAAAGEIIVPLDADLQNDPKDIPDMLNTYRQGYDVVSGWRKNREDKWISRVFSKVANRIIRSMTHLPLQDFGCSLKLYNAEKLKRICLHGELHRFIPALMSRYGIKIVEVPVTHHARRYGKSKYNLTRTFRVLLDLGTVMLHTQFMDKPLYLFGYLSLYALLVAFIFILAAILLVPHHIFAAAVLLLLATGSGVIFAMWLGFGFLAELLVMLRVTVSPEAVYYIENHTELE